MIMILTEDHSFVRLLNFILAVLAKQLKEGVDDIQLRSNNSSYLNVWKKGETIRLQARKPLGLQ